MSERVNQQLIADRLQISRATVSRCFTNHPGINPETRSRVFEMAAALGYRHMVTRTGDRREKGRLQSFGVLIATDSLAYQDPDVDTPAVQLVAGVSEFAQLDGSMMEIHFLPPGESDPDSPSLSGIEGLRRRDWDGVILVYPFEETILEELSERMPTVSLVEQYSSESIDSVDVDHHRGIAKIVRLLVREGHRRIGFLTHAYEVDSLWAMRRHAAYVEEMIRQGFAIDPGDVLNVRPDSRQQIEETHAAALERTRNGVTAWVCAADHEAYALVEFFGDHGVSVPGDVSVTGFDGLEPPKGAPELTTAEIPYHEIGLTGGRRLAELVRKPFAPAQHILLDARLRSGETVGEAP